MTTYLKEKNEMNRQYKLYISGVINYERYEQYEHKRE